MATVIYNHREMEYQCKMYWKEKEQIAFQQIFYHTENEKIKEAGCHLLAQIEKTLIPEDYAMDYGYDTMRLYLMFAGEPKKGQEYEEGALEGIYKFLNRLMILVHSCATGRESVAHNEERKLRALTDQEILGKLLTMNLRYGAKMEQYLLEKNAHMLVAAFMEQTTALSHIFHQYKACIPKEILMQLLQRLAPFAPFMSEALWRELDNQESIFQTAWPLCDSEQLEGAAQKVTIAVQMNGKTKMIMEFEQNATKTEVVSRAKELLQTRYPAKVKKIIFVPDKILNFVF